MLRRSIEIWTEREKSEEVSQGVGCYLQSCDRWDIRPYISPLSLSTQPPLRPRRRDMIPCTSVPHHRQPWLNYYLRMYRSYQLPVGSGRCDIWYEMAMNIIWTTTERSRLRRKMKRLHNFNQNRDFTEFTRRVGEFSFFSRFFKKKHADNAILHLTYGYSVICT